MEQDDPANQMKMKAANFVDRYVGPHKKPARNVTEDDLNRITKGKGTPEAPGEMTVMYALCYTKRGPYASAYAIAHPQIDDKDPLAFFVTREGHVIINPKIKRKTKHQLLRKEGCMTFPDRVPVHVERSYRLEVEYQTIDENNQLSTPEVLEVKGQMAQVFQHEIDHLNGECVYNETIQERLKRILHPNIFTGQKCEVGEHKISEADYTNFLEEVLPDKKYEPSNTPESLVFQGCKVTKE